MPKKTLITNDLGRNMILLQSITTTSTPDGQKELFFLSRHKYDDSIYLSLHRHEEMATRYFRLKKDQLLCQIKK